VIPTISAPAEKPLPSKPPVALSSERPLSPVRAKLAIITRHWHDPHDLASSSKKGSSNKQASSAGRNSQRVAIE